MALTAAERRLITGVVIIGSAFTTVAAAYNYVIGPMLDGLGASESQTSLLRQLPSIATLLVVFLGGVLGDRFGDRKVLYVSSILFTASSLVVAAAPDFRIAAAGLIVQSAALSAGAVVALGFLAAQISEPSSRASAFSVFAIVKPAIYLFVPIIAGALVDSRTWRLVPALWAVSGLVAIWACRLLPHTHRPRGSSELTTPILAGVVLSLVVQTINSGANTGWLSSDTLTRFGLAVVGLIALVILYRRVDSPSLSLAALRKGGMLILLAVVLLVPFATLWFYFTMGYQYIFGLSTLQTALAMIPAQLAGIVGALITRKVLQRRGVRFTGTATLAGFVGSLLLLLVIQATSPLWLVMGVVSIYGAVITSTSIPITNAIMNTAPAGEEGSASAWRTAASEIGMAVAVLFTMGILLTTVTTSLTGQLSAQGMATAQSKQIVDGILDGASTENLSSQYSVPVDDVEAISADLAVSIVDGLHVIGLAGAGIALLCTGIFNFAVRWEERAAARTRRPSDPPAAVS